MNARDICSLELMNIPISYFRRLLPHVFLECHIILDVDRIYIAVTKVQISHYQSTPIDTQFRMLFGLFRLSLSLSLAVCVRCAYTFTHLYASFIFQFR